MGGRGAAFLDASLGRLHGQSFADFEVVVSDQSDGEDVAQICARHGEALEIRRVDFRAGPRQASANTNHAMRQARGGILKILFQDDFLLGQDALAQIVAGMEAGPAGWLLCGSGVTRDGRTVERPMIPRLNAQMRFGRNTVSSPSVLALRAAEAMDFDEMLVWLMDVDFYDRCAQTLGPPVILPGTLVANRLHEKQVSARVTKAQRRAELRHVWAKQQGRAGWRDARAFAWQYLKAL